MSTIPTPIVTAGPPLRQRPRTTKALKLVGVVLGLFLVGYLIPVFLLFPPLPVPEDGIVVPDLAGQSAQSAEERLRPLGLQLGDTLSFPSPEVAPGLIVAQSPLPGQQMRAGGRVTLGLSSGLPSVSVPDVVSMDARRAENLLTRLGFGVDQVPEASERQSGNVIRSMPEAGQRQTLPARVRIWVSTGPIPDTSSVIDTTLRRDTIHRAVAPDRPIVRLPDRLFPLPFPHIEPPQPLR